MASKEKMTGIRLSNEQNYKIRYIADKNHRKLNDEFRLLVTNIYTGQTPFCHTD